MESSSSADEDEDLKEAIVVDAGQEAESSSADEDLKEADALSDESVAELEAASECSSADGNEDLKEIISKHEVVQFTVCSNVDLVKGDLSTILEDAEDKTLDASHFIATPDADDAQEEDADESCKNEDILQIEEQYDEARGSEEEGMVAEEAAPLVDNRTEEAKEESENELRRSVRARAPRKSNVLLPFTGASWQPRDRSPSSVTSEPPQPFESDLVTVRSRRRRHSSSSSVPPTASALTRRSSRLSSVDATAPPAPDMVVPTRTPPKRGRPRRNTAAKPAAAVAAADVGEMVEAAPDSGDESSPSRPGSVAGSACGTPIRRSARIALKETTTPDHALIGNAVAALTYSGRARRGSLDAASIGSPLRRSGRRSVEPTVSRDTSPQGSDAEPGAPGADAATPKRGRPPKSLKVVLRPVSLSLLPLVEEEAEAAQSKSSARVVASPLRRSGRKSVEPASRDASPHASDAESTAAATPKRGRPPKASKAAQKAVAVDLFPLVEEDAEVEQSEEAKVGAKPAPSTSSSPSSARYNLRGRRNSELGCISEEDAKTAIKEIKRRRDVKEGEESSQSDDGQSAAKRVTRSKRRKAEVEEEGKNHCFVFVF